MAEETAGADAIASRRLQLRLRQAKKEAEGIIGGIVPDVVRDKKLNKERLEEMVEKGKQGRLTSIKVKEALVISRDLKEKIEEVPDNITIDFSFGGEAASKRAHQIGLAIGLTKKETKELEKPEVKKAINQFAKKHQDRLQLPTGEDRSRLAKLRRKIVERFPGQLSEQSLRNIPILWEAAKVFDGEATIEDKEDRECLMKTWDSLNSDTQQLILKTRRMFEMWGVDADTIFKERVKKTDGGNLIYRDRDGNEMKRVKLKQFLNDGLMGTKYKIATAYVNQLRQEGKIYGGRAEHVNLDPDDLARVKISYLSEEAGELSGVSQGEMMALLDELEKDGRFGEPLSQMRAEASLLHFHFEFISRLHEKIETDHLREGLFADLDPGKISAWFRYIPNLATVMNWEEFTGARDKETGRLNDLGDDNRHKPKTPREIFKKAQRKIALENARIKYENLTRGHLGKPELPLIDQTTIDYAFMAHRLMLTGADIGWTLGKILTLDKYYKFADVLGFATRFDISLVQDLTKEEEGVFLRFIREESRFSIGIQNWMQYNNKRLFGNPTMEDDFFRTCTGLSPVYEVNDQDLELLRSVLGKVKVINDYGEKVPLPEDRINRMIQWQKKGVEWTGQLRWMGPYFLMSKGYTTDQTGKFIKAKYIFNPETERHVEWLTDMVSWRNVLGEEEFKKIDTVVLQGLFVDIERRAGKELGDLTSEDISLVRNELLPLAKTDEDKKIINMTIKFLEKIPGLELVKKNTMLQMVRAGIDPNDIVKEGWINELISSETRGAVHTYMKKRRLYAKDLTPTQIENLANSNLTPMQKLEVILRQKKTWGIDFEFNQKWIDRLQGQGGPQAAVTLDRMLRYYVEYWYPTYKKILATITGLSKEKELLKVSEVRKNLLEVFTHVEHYEGLTHPGDPLLQYANELQHRAWTKSLNDVIWTEKLHGAWIKMFKSEGQWQDYWEGWLVDENNEPMVVTDPVGFEAIMQEKAEEKMLEQHNRIDDRIVRWMNEQQSFSLDLINKLEQDYGLYYYAVEGPNGTIIGRKHKLFKKYQAEALGKVYNTISIGARDSQIYEQALFSGEIPWGPIRQAADMGLFVWDVYKIWGFRNVGVIAAQFSDELAGTEVGYDSFEVLQEVVIKRSEELAKSELGRGIEGEEREQVEEIIQALEQKQIPRDILDRWVTRKEGEFNELERKLNEGEIGKSQFDQEKNKLQLGRWQDFSASWRIYLHRLNLRAVGRDLNLEGHMRFLQELREEGEGGLMNQASPERFVDQWQREFKAMGKADLEVKDGYYVNIPEVMARFGRYYWGIEDPLDAGNEANRDKVEKLVDFCRNNQRLSMFAVFGIDVGPDPQKADPKSFPGTYTIFMKNFVHPLATQYENQKKLNPEKRIIEKAFGWVDDVRDENLTDEEKRTLVPSLEKIMEKIQENIDLCPIYSEKQAIPAHLVEGLFYVNALTAENKDVRGQILKKMEKNVQDIIAIVGDRSRTASRELRDFAQTRIKDYILDKFIKDELPNGLREEEKRELIAQKSATINFTSLLSRDWTDEEREGFINFFIKENGEVNENHIGLMNLISFGVTPLDLQDSSLWSETKNVVQQQAGFVKAIEKTVEKIKSGKVKWISKDEAKNVQTTLNGKLEYLQKNNEFYGVENETIRKAQETNLRFILFDVETKTKAGLINDQFQAQKYSSALQMVEIAGNKKLRMDQLYQIEEAIFGLTADEVITSLEYTVIHAKPQPINILIELFTGAFKYNLAGEEWWQEYRLKFGTRGLAIMPALVGGVATGASFVASFVYAAIYPANQATAVISKSATYFQLFGEGFRGAWSATGGEAIFNLVGGLIKAVPALTAAQTLGLIFVALPAANLVVNKFVWDPLTKFYMTKIRGKETYIGAHAYHIVKSKKT